MRSPIFLTALSTLALLSPFASGAPAIEERRESFVSEGRNIGVRTFAPAGAGRRPGVIVLHSSAGTLFGDGEMVRFSRAIAAQGQVALLVRYFDRTGTTFAGDGAITKWWPTWERTVRDAVDFATQHPRVDPSRLGMFGYSLGAYLAVAEASRDPRIDAVAELAGGIFRGNSARMQRMPPLLILHGRADRRVAFQYAAALEARARALGAVPEVHVYDGEGHVLSPTAQQDAMRRALRFLERRLPARRS